MLYTTQRNTAQHSTQHNTVLCCVVAIVSLRFVLSFVDVVVDAFVYVVDKNRSLRQQAMRPSSAPCLPGFIPWPTVGTSDRWSKMTFRKYSPFIVLLHA
jgi:hypothetical protein